ncbi:N-acetyl-gamma-glutamyl-phosphate reductase [Gallaecimonas sp. GXIMD4217]|uniref:N-acetyl-gamma-glutamyl-phosphate reductase n=1 Tax=Gallaecimonas sp. GXIMD4217 TaxID=3131927 RepID=UPI00311ABE74
MLNTLIIGGAGYTGQELCKLVARHPQLRLTQVFGSPGGQHTGEALPLGCGQGVIEDGQLDAILSAAWKAHVILLATPHQASSELVPLLMAQSQALIVDLSGAFRLPADLYPLHYGFAHQAPELLDSAVYGLVGWNDAAIRESRLIAAPGCYPTAALLGLKPLARAGLIQGLPIINAVSGVSGAGRKATAGNAFCEVSLKPYGVLGHRHQPEIDQHLGQSTLFTPHLGAFERGILATMAVPVTGGLAQEQASEVFEAAYGGHASILLSGDLKQQTPSVKAVAHSPYAQLGWALDPDKQLLLVVSAIDNLLKGAASQALECINIHFDFQLTPVPGPAWEA